MYMYRYVNVQMMIMNEYKYSPPQDPSLLDCYVRLASMERARGHTEKCLEVGGRGGQHFQFSVFLYSSVFHDLTQQFVNVFQKGHLT